MKSKYDEKIFELNQLRIRQELALVDKKQAWLAAQIGETRQRWHYYYHKKSLKHLKNIAKVLNIPEKELVSPRTDIF